MEFLSFTTGFAFFLWGLFGFERCAAGIAGPGLKKTVKKFTGKFLSAFLCGFVLTACVQSSSLVLITLIALAKAKVVNFKNSFGVIMGANLGTTITTHFFSWKLEEKFYLFFILSVLVYFFSSKKGRKIYYRIFFFLGVLFFGFYLLKINSNFIQNLVYGRGYDFISQPLGGLASGIVLTSIVQSSSVVSGMVVLLALQGILSLTQAIPVIMGTNIGTCTTAILASLFADEEGQKIAFAHLFFNLFGTMFWFPLRVFIGFLVLRLSSVPARQVAFFHSFFNLLTVLVFLPFIPLFQKLIDKFFSKENGR